MTHRDTSKFLRHDWATDEIVAIHDLPLLDLIAEANRVHRHFHDVGDIQKASLLSIKTGGCPENCAYCPQSAHYREVRRRKARGGEGLRIEISRAQNHSVRFVAAARPCPSRNGP